MIRPQPQHIGVFRALALAPFAVSTLIASPAAAQFFAADTEALPVDPKPGECYARVMIPPNKITKEKAITVKEASETLTVTQAEYRWATKQIEVEAASERVEVTPAQFEMVTRTVVIEPEREVVEALPPVFETVEEDVLVRPAYTKWKKGSGPIQKIDLATGEIMCLVTVPAEYEKVKRQVVRIPARTVVKKIPARTEEIKVKVMTAAPQVRRIQIPAKTKEMRVLEMVRDWSQEVQKAPAETVMMTETVKVEPQRMEWRPILCETNSKPGLVRELQVRLRGEGFDPGRIDGRLGPATLSALSAYQRANGLAEGNVTIETLETLGIDHRA